jgi:hypothetical protein
VGIVASDVELRTRECSSASAMVTADRPAKSCQAGGAGCFLRYH